MLYTFSILFRIAILSALLISGCENFNTEEKIPAPSQKVAEKPLVKVASVKRCDICVPILSTGTLFPQHESKIGPKISGTIVKVYVDEGDRVKKGQTLAELERESLLIAERQCEASIRVAEAQLKEAMAKEENLRKEKARLANLFEKKVISRQRYDDIDTVHSMAKTRLEVIRAEIVSCKENLAMAEQKLRDTVIVAPFSGFIVKRFVNQGEYVTTMPPTILFLIMNIDMVKTEVGLPELHLASVGMGNPVEITADTFPGVTFKGKISTINPMVDPVSRAFTVKVAIPNRDHRLKPGMFARVKIFPRIHQDALVVPYKAVVWSGGGASVFLLDGDRVSRRRVTVGIDNEREIEVLAGLEEGEEVVIEGHYGMEDKTTVRVVRE